MTQQSKQEVLQTKHANAKFRASTIKNIRWVILTKTLLINSLGLLIMGTTYAQ
jgi:hypothetical protein